MVGRALGPTMRSKTAFGWFGASAVAVGAALGLYLARGTSVAGAPTRSSAELPPDLQALSRSFPRWWHELVSIRNKLLDNPNDTAASARLLDYVRGGVVAGDGAAQCGAIGVVGSVAKSHATGMSDTFLPSLVELLGHDDQSVVGEAAIAVGEFGRLAEDAVDELANVALRERDSRSGRLATEALGAIRRRPEVAVPVLARLVSTRDPSLAGSWGRGSALEALGAFGPDAAAAIPVIIEALSDPDPRYRSDAVVALAQIDPARQELIEFIRTKHPKEDAFHRGLQLRILRDAPSLPAPLLEVFRERLSLEKDAENLAAIRDFFERAPVGD